MTGQESESDQSTKACTYKILGEPVANPRYEGMTMREIVLGLAKRDHEKEQIDPSDRDTGLEFDL